jgi:hypothetical protein
MTYFPDLSPCTYICGAPAGLLSVGWLSRWHLFPQGPTSEQFRSALAECCRRPEIQHRGFHECPFCKFSLRGVLLRLFGRRPAQGSAVIYVSGKGGKIYAAPTLILHYVSAHWYRPPAEFVQAVLADKVNSAGSRAAK